MGQARDEAGNIWETDANGNPVRLIRPAGQGGVFSLPPDPMEQARLSLAQQAAARAQAQMPSADERALRQQLLAAQVQQAQAQAAKAREGTAGASQGDVKIQQRRANLNALDAQIKRVRELYQRNLKGGFPNWIAGNVPDGIRPENGQFESAAAGLGEIGMAAFRVPGVGSQSDAELKNFILANTPQPGDSDARIEEKLRTLETRLNATRKEAGISVPQQDPNGRINFQSNKDKPPRNLPPGATATYDPSTDSWTTRYKEADDVPEGALEVSVVGGRMNPEDQARLDRMLSGTDQFGSGLVGFTDAATFGLSDEAGGAIDALTGALTGKGSFGDLYNRNVDINRRYQDALQQRDPGSSLAGSVLGSTVGMVGVNSLLRNSGRLAPLATRAGGLGGDALYGAAYGAGASDDNRALGAVTGAGAAAVGNVVGNKIVGGIGRVATGVTNPAVKYLADRGIPMTPGQIFGESGMLGRTARGIEDKLQSVPFLGDAISARRDEGLQAFNREAFKDAVKPIGGQVEGMIGEDAIDQAQGLVSNAYGDALNGVTLRPDGQFIRETNRILNDGMQIPVAGEQFKYLVGNKIDPLFDNSLNLDGRGFQSALQTLNRAVPEFNKQGIMGNEAADAARAMRDEFVGLAGRRAPQVMPQLNAANAANRNVSILEDAVLGSINAQAGRGMFTPAQLGRAAVNNGKKFGGKKQAAAGNVPFADLTRYGQDVLPSTVPNSGTADRALATFVLPTALGGAAVGSESLDMPSYVSVPLALLAASTTKKGSKFIQSAATKRNPLIGDIGEEILKRRRLGGMFGAGAALPLIGY